jgi:ATP-binding cassette subfamily B protein
MDDITTYSKIAYYATVVAILTVFGLIFAMVAEIIGMYVNTRIVKNLRYKLVQKVSKLPLKYYDGNTIGNTLSRITNDADSLSQNLPNFFMSIFQGFCMIVGLVIAMFSVS